MSTLRGSFFYKLKYVIMYIGDIDVLFNKFDTTAYNAPHNPPYDPESEYNCVVATTGYWRLSRCSDTQRVVCQSG